MKRRVVALVEVLILLIVFILCSGTGDVLPNVNATGLPAPTNVRVENGYVIWNPVEHVVKGSSGSAGAFVKKCTFL